LANGTRGKRQTGGMTDETDAFADLLEANRRHRATFTLIGLPARAARRLGIVTCIDTRLDPLAMLGLAPGDAKIVRNAGARVTDDVIRSLALATAFLDVERVAVIQHTHCAVAGSSADVLRDGVHRATGADTSAFDPLAMDDQEATLRVDVERIRRDPLIPRHVVVAGFVYDVDNGELIPH
jgi:carbonic anhydrase